LEVGGDEYSNERNSHSISTSILSAFTPLRATIFLFLAFILSLSSCQTKADRMKVGQVDSISYRMEATAEVYLQIDTLKVDSIYKTLLSNYDKLNKLENIGNQQLIIEYGTLKKGLKEFIRRRPSTMQELEFCRKQLKALRQDAGRGLLSDDDFEVYLKHEADASQNMRVQMSYYQVRIQNQIEKFEKLNPQIENLIDSLSIEQN
jgi:hypothetical protein